MDSLHSGSNKPALLSVQTDCVAVTIRGPASHPDHEGVENSEKLSSLRIYCDDDYQVLVKGESEVGAVFRTSSSVQSEHEVQPLFFEQRNYEIIIEDLRSKEKINESDLGFWHDNLHVRNAVSHVGTKRNLMTGVINFGNDIGMSDLVIRIRGNQYLRIVIEVFPSKISYRDDYQAILADVTSEIYNLVFDFLKKTYRGYRQSDKTQSSPVEFFAVIRKIYDDFIRATDLILSRPHHILETTHEVLPNHKIKRIDNQTLRWIEKHPSYAQRRGSRIAVSRAQAVKKQVTYDTKENRLTKHMLTETVKKLESFEQKYRSLLRATDPEIEANIHTMIRKINARCNATFLADIPPLQASSGMSLVFTMAPGYRDLYKYYLMLRRGLSITGDVFNISEKDLSVLYEYWCFIKLNAIMKEQYKLISQDIIKVQANGLFVSLAKGEESRVRYLHPRTGENITLLYNRRSTALPTVSQRPDNVLSLEKKGASTSYEYVFDAKYRINPAKPNTDYARNISPIPGPETDDINTMHRYRDAIVSDSGASPFEREMFGAYVLFPYANEDEYKNHRFYRSIEKVNIGGLPFLPSATDLVREMLTQLVEESPDTAFERATLPRGIETKLAKVDWSVRDVLVGALSNKTQLDAALKHRFYHVPVLLIAESALPIRYVAIYQSYKLFGKESGIHYFGEVTRCTELPRNEIKEIPSTKTDLYYRFEVKEWQKLNTPIKVKAGLRTRGYTNLFLLRYSSEVSEIFIRSEIEFRLYNELKRITGDISINDDDVTKGFLINDKTIYINNGEILIGKESKIVARYTVSEFEKRPGATVRRMKEEV